jgi:hypothetical protein
MALTAGVKATSLMVCIVVSMFPQGFEVARQDAAVVAREMAEILIDKASTQYRLGISRALVD